MRALLDRLRGARHIEFFAVLILLAVLALMLNRFTGGGGGDSLEARLQRLLGQIDGVGRVSAMVTQDEDGTVRGAVIVAEGLQSVRAALEIQTAVQTLLEIDAARVRIITDHGIYGGATG